MSIIPWFPQKEECMEEQIYKSTDLTYKTVQCQCLYYTSYANKYSLYPRWWNWLMFADHILN